ncbi:hypothetical protein [Pseudoclavibacter sp. RFBA6]|uniref:hypothetical protein n=1 Tax=Pseudoclavibacter sp. RFBA6 TaxID=2080573 RepID=UPI000CE77436|nr:hypothetical protein [Pseudoclavibacter sp. RFBA6]PPG39453.1 hypothetical protein C5C17_11725 [Pseudoclavibacter sp. RFBA6]
MDLDHRDPQHVAYVLPIVGKHLIALDPAVRWVSGKHIIAHVIVRGPTGEALVADDGVSLVLRRQRFRIPANHPLRGVRPPC